MRLQYLGTAAAEGWPAVFCGCAACKKARELGGKNIRTRAQALVDGQLLLDLPPDTYYHALREGLALETIGTLLVTHTHQDHFYPLELLMRGAPYCHTPEAPLLTVYGSKDVQRCFLQAMELNDSPDIEEHLRFVPVEAGVPFTVPGGYTITSLEAVHAPGEDCRIYLIEKDGHSMLYGHDSGMYPEQTWEILKKTHLDLVSFDCTCVEEKDGHYHMGLPDNREARDKMLQTGCADENTLFVVSHFSHNGKLAHDEIETLAQKDGFIAAYDGMTLEF